MTFDPKKPVSTRSGHKARIICTDANDPPYSIIALITDPDDGIENIETYTSEGLYWKKEGPVVQDEEPCKNDLINIPERTVRYMNIYPCSQTPAHQYDSLEWVKNGKSAKFPNASVIQLTFADKKLVEVEIVAKQS